VRVGAFVGERDQWITCSPLDARLALFDELNQLELHYDKSEIRRFHETVARRNESRFLPRA